MKKVAATLSTLAMVTAGLTGSPEGAFATPAPTGHKVVGSTGRCSDRSDYLSLTSGPNPLGPHWYSLHLSFTTTASRARRHWTLAEFRVHPNNSIFFDFNVTDFAFTALGRRRGYSNDQIVRNLPGTDHFLARVSDPTHHQVCTTWLSVKP